MTSVELAYHLLLLLLLLLELIQDLLIDVLPQRLVLRLQLGGKLLQMLDLVLILVKLVPDAALQGSRHQVLGK